MHETNATYLTMLKALSDDTRLKITGMLASGTLCACDILESFQITQPTLSYHMKLLTACHLVRAQRIGAWMHYTLETNRYQQLLEFMADLIVPNPASARVPSSTCCPKKVKEANQ